MINGSVVLLNDPNLAFSMINAGTIVLLLTEEIAADPNNNDVVPATILLPPYQAKLAEIDGDAEMFYTLYSEHLLNCEPALDILNVMIAILNNGFNVVLLTTSEIDSVWAVQLSNHLATYYGIHISIVRNGMEICPFYFDVQYWDTINNVLYSSDLETSAKYLTNCRTVQIPEHILYKLQAELRYSLDVTPIGMNTTYLALAAQYKLAPPTKTELEPAVSFTKRLYRGGGI